MASRAFRPAITVAAAGIVALLATPGAARASGTTEPPVGSDPAGSAGCAEVAALLASRTTLATALMNGDPALIEATLAELSSVASAATNAAPAEIDAEIDTLAATVDATVTALEGVELSDTAAVLAALEPTESEATGEAFPVVIQWAIDNCGYVVVRPVRRRRRAGGVRDPRRRCSRRGSRHRRRRDRPRRQRRREPARILDEIVLVRQRGDEHVDALVRLYRGRSAVLRRQPRCRRRRRARRRYRRAAQSRHWSSRRGRRLASIRACRAPTNRRPPPRRRYRSRCSRRSYPVLGVVHRRRTSVPPPWSPLPRHCSPRRRRVANPHRQSRRRPPRFDRCRDGPTPSLVQRAVLRRRCATTSGTRDCRAAHGADRSGGAG